MDVKKQANKIARMFKSRDPFETVSYTHLRAHET